jgi:transcriptional regulator with XRE-family HTH domain
MAATDLEMGDAGFLLRARTRLKTVRQRSGLTLREVASAAGMSTSALSRLESGARPLTLLHLCRLAGALGISPDALLSAPEPMSEANPAADRTSDGREWQQIPVPTASAFHAHLVTLMPGDPGSGGRSHTGRQWIFVLTGSLRLGVGGRSRTLGAGDHADFSTQLVHELRAEGQPTVLLSVFQAS